MENIINIRNILGRFMTLTFAFVGRLNIDRRLLKQSRYWCRAVLPLVLTLSFNDGVDDDDLRNLNL